MCIIFGSVKTNYVCEKCNKTLMSVCGVSFNKGNLLFDFNSAYLWLNGEYPLFLNGCNMCRCGGYLNISSYWFGNKVLCA